jgi:hypothetical protein
MRMTDCGYVPLGSLDRVVTRLRRLPRRKTGRVVAVAAAALLAASCSRTPPALNGFGAIISPASPGPFVPCGMTPTVDVGGFPVAPKDLVLYLPRSSASEPCGEKLGAGRQLTLLYHALGASNNWADYADLGLHLASHGIVMASLAHDVGVSEVIEYFDEIDVDPSREVAMIGHSAGGDLIVQRRGQVASSGGVLKAMVLIAPRVSTDPFFDYSLSGAEAFLGLHWTRDTDPSTWGAPAQGPRRSVFRIYDRAGVDFDAPFEPTLWKNFAFFDFFPGTHFEQGRPGVIAYVTAVLRRQFYDDAGQDAFLRAMGPISGLLPPERPIAQQHSRRERVRIANFEEDQTLVPPIYGGVFDNGVSFTGGPAVVPAWTDKFSPHDLGVLRFNFVAQSDVERSVAIHFGDKSIDVSDQTYLSFRIAQEYHPTLAPTGEAVVFDVALQTPDDVIAQAEDHGGPLDFPVIVPNLLLSQTHEFVDATKNAMRTYLIPLSAFGGADLSQVGVIKFDFRRAQTVPGRRMFFVVDDVEFVQ